MKIKKGNIKGYAIIFLLATGLFTLPLLHGCKKTSSQAALNTFIFHGVTFRGTVTECDSFEHSSTDTLYETRFVGSDGTGDTILLILDAPNSRGTSSFDSATYYGNCNRCAAAQIEYWNTSTDVGYYGVGSMTVNNTTTTISATFNFINSTYITPVTTSTPPFQSGQASGTLGCP